MKGTLGVAVVLVAALMLFAPTSDAGIYAGASVTQTALDVDDVDFDEDDTGLKVFGGWTFFKFLGLEASYYDMGSLDNNSDSVDLTAFGLVARGILPVGEHLELFAKAGYMAWDSESSSFGDNDDTDLTYGVGAAWVFGGHISIRAEYEILDVDEADVDLFSLGAAFRF
ncbi:MAG: porin family protein [Acidobacteria bacterium]|nr:MAG: porin family protein [Acidobacteriota bacterium]